MTVDRAVGPEGDGGHRDDVGGSVDQLPEVVRSVVTTIAVGGRPSSCALAEAFGASVDLAPPTRDVVLASLMTATMMCGPRVEDVEALLRQALVVDDREPAVAVGGRRPVLVLAGSGKKGRRTANITTPAALVAAAAGVEVVKVGSGATSSMVGSRDLVGELGLQECRTAGAVRSALAVSGFAFVPVEPAIPRLDALYGGRFHAPNPFSFGLGLLASPVRGDVAVLGLAHPRVDVAAEVLARFGFSAIDVMATCLPDGSYVDEVWPVGDVRWCRVRNGCPGMVTVDEWRGEAAPGALAAPGGVEQAAVEVLSLLAGGGREDHRGVVVHNAAHLLVLGEVVSSVADGVDLAREVLQDGAALTTLREASATVTTGS